MIIIEGGHAITLSVEFPDAVKLAIDSFVSKRDDRRVKKSPHVTMMFAGRNLTEQKGRVLRQVTWKVRPEVPRLVQLDSLDLFGRSKDHLVATVKPDSGLLGLRKRIEEELQDRQLTMFDTLRAMPIIYGWRPHVTLCIVEKVPPSAWRASAGDRAELLNAIRGVDVTVRFINAKTGSRYTSLAVAPSKVLFVCHGNINRSPAAELIARKDRPDLEVRSVGVRAVNGRITAKKMRVALSAAGYQASTVSEVIDEEPLRWADVVYYMDNGNRTRLIDNFPAYYVKYRSLAELIGKDKIPDPHFTNDLHGTVVEMLREAIQRI